MDTHVPTCINAVEKLSKNEKSIAKNVPIIVIAVSYTHLTLPTTPYV